MMPNDTICHQPRRTPDSFFCPALKAFSEIINFAWQKGIKTQKYFGSNSVESAYLRCIQVNAKTNMVFCSQLLSRGFKSRNIETQRQKWKLSIYKNKPLSDTRRYQDLVTPNSPCILKIVGCQENWLAVQKYMKLDYYHYLTFYTKTNSRQNTKKEKKM